MLKKWFFILVLMSSIHGFGQGVVLNFDLDTTAWDISKPTKVWLDFLKSGNDTLGAAYWNQEELNKYGTKNYFGLKRELDFGQPDYLSLIALANIRVMSVRKRGDYFKITNILSFINRQNKDDVYFIFHVYVGRENGKFKLYNALKVNAANEMFSQKVGFIRYFYPKDHEFNLTLAKKQNDFLVELAHNFQVPVVEVDYYFASTTEEIQRIKGFDFNFGDNGISMPSGVSYIPSREIFTSGLGEYYPHEIIHVLLNPYFLRSHYWTNEGVATYFGMSRGKHLDWHLKKLQAFLPAHPEVNLSNMLSLVKLDGATGYSYVLGGFIVKRIFENGGYPALKRAMGYGRSEKDFYRMIEAELGVKRKAINVQFREWIAALKFE